MGELTSARSPNKAPLSLLYLPPLRSWTPLGAREVSVDLAVILYYRAINFITIPSNLTTMQLSFTTIPTDLTDIL